MTAHEASSEEQVGWASASALVVAAGERRVLEVTGEDRLSWLNGLLTCELLSRKPGDVVRGLAVAQKGKIMSDVLVLVGVDRVRLVVQAATVDALTASFEHHLMMEDAELRRAPADVWFVHGPRAAQVLEAATRAGAAGGALDLTGRGGAVIVTRDGDGDGDHGEHGAAAALQAAARDAGGGTGDARGWEVVRVLAGVPRFGVDFDDGTYPQEAALETTAVSFEKGCYLGQEVVCMLEMRGHVKRKLVSLALATPHLPGNGNAPVPAPRSPVMDAKGTAVGEVTSAVREGEGTVRALAMVKYAFIAKGTELVVDGQAARVV